MSLQNILIIALLGSCSLIVVEANNLYKKSIFQKMRGYCDKKEMSFEEVEEYGRNHNQYLFYFNKDVANFRVLPDADVSKFLVHQILLLFLQGIDCYGCDSLSC